MAKYHDIYQDLLEKIQREEIAPNSYLPSENELMKIYDASRDTVRKALALLDEKGLILKEKGRGSKVLDHSVVTFPMSGITSFRELKDSMEDQIDIHTQVIECKYDKDPTGQKELDLPESADVCKVVRTRSFDGEKVILDIDYLNGDLIPGVTEDIAGHSLYDYIEKELGLPIAFARKEITVEPASELDKKLLDLKGYDLVACVRSSVYLEDATLFEYSESRHRPDKFKFLDFARREPI